MTFINPTGGYSHHIYGTKKNVQAENQDVSQNSPIKENKPQTEPKKQVSAEDIFKYMSSSYAQVKPSKPVKVSAYVDAESNKRIQQSVNQFENLFNKTLNVIKNEFGDILSDDAMNTLTLQLLT